MCIYVVAYYAGNGDCGPPLVAYKLLSDLRMDYPKAVDFDGEEDPIVGDFVFSCIELD